MDEKQLQQNRDNDIKRLIKILVSILEGTKGLKIESELLDAETLCRRVLFSSSAGYRIYENGISIPGHEHIGVIRDVGVVNLLLRGTIESFLVLHHIYVSTMDNKTLREFRCLCWRIEGFSKRLNFVPSSNVLQEQIENNRSVVDGWRKKLEQNECFREKSEKEQKECIKKGKQQFRWQDIAIAAGFSEKNANDFYVYLCDYAHSGSVSNMQLTSPPEKLLFEVPLYLTAIVLANTIESYIKLFPNGVSYIEENEKEVIKKWIFMGTTHDV